MFSPFGTALVRFSDMWSAASMGGSLVSKIIGCWKSAIASSESGYNT